MFAAAAVAAAAALTAISTTQPSSSQCLAKINGATLSKTANIPTAGGFNQLVPVQNSQSHHIYQPTQADYKNLNLSQFQRWNTSDPSPPSTFTQFHAASSARSLDVYSTDCGSGRGDELCLSNQHGGLSNLTTTMQSRPYISWKQYAMQRRNSMQRRKIEISRRLEQASSANQKKTYNIQQFQSSKQKSSELNESIQSRRSFVSEVDSNRLRRQNTTATTDSQETSINDQWLRQLSTHVCNEFLKMHQSGQINALEYDDSEITDNTDLLENIDLSMHPTYKNFDSIAQLMQLSRADPNSFDFDKISQAMYEYLRALNITQEKISGIGLVADSFDGANSNPINGGGEEGLDDNYLTNLGNNRNCLKKDTIHSQQLKRRKEERLNYLITHRWDPQWLRSLRTNFCIPFAILALIFLIFTHLNSNWIRFDKNLRAGLWSICNTSRLENVIENDQFFVSNGSKEFYEATILRPTLSQKTASEVSNNRTLIQVLKSTLSTKAFVDGKKKDFFAKEIKKLGNVLTTSHEIEDCYSKFFLQEDTHLAIVCLSLISLFFHIIGTILLIIGFISSLSQRSLYFYHSAGECLITSAIVHIIQLTAFGVIVQVQNSSHSFRLGYCFYINTLLSLLTLCCSIILHLDDIVNEWKIWKVKTDSIKSTAVLIRTPQNVNSTKPADIFLSSI